MIIVNLEEKAVKETLKRIIDNNEVVPHKATIELKMTKNFKSVINMRGL